MNDFSSFFVFIKDFQHCSQQSLHLFQHILNEAVNSTVTSLDSLIQLYHIWFAFASFRGVEGEN